MSVSLYCLSFWADVSLVIYLLMRPPSLPPSLPSIWKTQKSDNSQYENWGPAPCQEVLGAAVWEEEGGRTCVKEISRTAGGRWAVDTNYTETWLLSVSQNNDEAEKSLRMDELIENWP